ncbi:hypothetical protein ACKVMT_00405 [Halobacteriales archaeon Cl-PHB]
MTREALATAADLLADAADAADGDASDRLTDIADQVEDRATAERGPDHGRMARWQTALGDLKADVDDEVAATIESALEEIRDYRSTVEGV